jgi:hypothetical protein
MKSATNSRIINTRCYVFCALFSGLPLATEVLAMGEINTNRSQAVGFAYSEKILDKYCSRCHNDERMSGDWSLSTIHSKDISQGTNLSQWEKILRMTQTAEMPPSNRPQPTIQERQQFIDWLESSLDNYSRLHPNPGRATLRRLNRAEYSNAVRDLLALDIGLDEELPADDSGYGFDNIADVLSVSSTLMDRYLSVAGKVSRLALGLAPKKPTLTSFTVPKDGSILNQGVPSYNYRMSDELPLDSRGGGAFHYYAPYDGQYEISAYLNANTNNEIDRLAENRYSLRVYLDAGQHSIGMAFRKELALNEQVQILRNTTDVIVLPSEAPRPLTLDFIVDSARVGSTSVPSYHISPRFSQINFLRDVLQIDVQGPFDISGQGDTASRSKILTCQPQQNLSSQRECAEKILSKLARQAYRRPLDQKDIMPLLAVYEQSREYNEFEDSLAVSIQALLVAPSFLFLPEQIPVDAIPGDIYLINDFEFAARLALFLWSSLPDETLLQAAENGNLRQPNMLKQQVNRMLSDPRAQALTENFAGQWLYLRNLQYQYPDVMLFPDFDIPLKQAMKSETELFFSDIVRNNQSVLSFLSSDYSFMNQRLAEHYGIDGVKGTAFRRVNVADNPNRGGLLGQASILTVTSYGNHTSVVKRGKWILDNLLASPPPPPPPDVPALKASEGGHDLNAREQLERHRADPACASCHVKMDPLGLALEQFDAVGAFRTKDAGRLIDISAVMPDGTEFNGLAGLQAVLLSRKNQFANAFTQRLMTYALGRGIEAYDMPEVRYITRLAEADEYRIRSIIMGIINSKAFTMRSKPNEYITQATR